jgi:DNA invertase Pin-like site-specific DNA recombinase
VTTANRLRLLLAARKSRKSADGDDSMMYERQDQRAELWAKREGHVIVARVADTKSGTVAPWDRKNLKPWMTDPVKLASYDAILVSDTDRLSRGTQEDFVYIEHWASEHGKRIIVAKGPQYPARTDSERGDWDGQKRRARTYWEDVRDKHADTREIIKANGGAIGRPPYGYLIEGPKLRKTFVIDPVTGPIMLEAFQRIANGRTITSVALWLTEVTGFTWRLMRVTETIKRRSYLGSRDGHDYEPLITEALWEAANSALAARTVPHGGRSVVHAYSSVIYCLCGLPYYRHQSVSKDGSDIGAEKYRCSRGRRNHLGEGPCSYPPVPFDAANVAVDALMRDDFTHEWMRVTTGGDSGRQMELQRIQDEMTAAMTRKDMGLVTTLAVKFAEVDSQPAEPIRTVLKKTGRTKAEAWETGTLSDQRAMLGDYPVTVFLRSDGTVGARWKDVYDDETL